MKILNIIAISLACSAFAQIGISSNPNFVMHPDAAIHIEEGNHVVKFPHVSLQGISDIITVENPTVGLMVYNTNDGVSPRKGFCYWDGSKWINYEDTKAVLASEVDLEEVSINMLGYNPEGKATQAANTFSFTNGSRTITFTKQGCVKFEGNNHTYCGYTTNIPLDWKEAFIGAKMQKGYMVTITSKKEWDFIVNNFYRNQNLLINGESNKNFRSLIQDSRRIWIGYNKVKPIGYHQQFTWITGEASEVDWLTGKRFSGFAPNEPNDSQGNEGCSHIHKVNDAVVNFDLNKLSWNDTPCDLATVNHTAMAPVFHIFEFNQ